MNLEIIFFMHTSLLCEPCMDGSRIFCRAKLFFTNNLRHIARHKNQLLFVELEAHHSAVEADTAGAYP